MKTKSRKTVLVLRTCSKDMTSQNGFKWPKKGKVEAPDWDGGKMVCGGGLHGLEMGEQSGRYLDWSPDAVWLVVKVTVADGYATGGGDLMDKCKFRRGVVVYCGEKDGAVAYLLANGANVEKLVGASQIGGGSSKVTGGDYSTLAVWWWDGKRRRLIVAYVGEDGIKADTWYKVEGGKFVEVK